MIREYAVEPDVPAQSYRDCSYFLEKFGVEYGRLISRFPGNWKRLVYEAAKRRHDGMVELSRIEEYLARLKPTVLFASGRPGGDANQPWISRAITENARMPFAGIIATTMPADSQEIWLASELDESNVAFRALGQKHIGRTSDEIVACVRPLLKCAKLIKLIDPYFKASEPRYGRALAKLLCELGPGTIVEIHRANDALPGNVRNWFDRAIPPLLSNGICLKIFLHVSSTMHNRFILTDMGGASFHTGLDDNEGDRRDSTREDLVTLLSAAVYAAEWDRYAGIPVFAEYRAVAADLRT